MTNRETAKRIALQTAFVLFAVALGFLLVAGAVYIGSFVFPYEFSWLLVLECYFVVVLLKILLKILIG